MTQATAATTGERQADGPNEPPGTRDARSLSLGERLALKRKALRRHRSTIRFFETHRHLLAAGESQESALGALRRAVRGARKATREVAYYERLVREQRARVSARRLANAPPRVAICAVFGRYCRQAIAVAWCESRLSPDARNGEYLGLFQMSSTARRIFGHGHTAHRQALAAHAYFVRSGRDWSPWGCRWAAY